MTMRLSRADLIPGAAIHSTGHAGAPSALRAAAAMIALWRVRHRQRRDIGRLDDHMLRDIGLDRVTADEIAARPFWKA